MSVQLFLLWRHTSKALYFQLNNNEMEKKCDTKKQHVDRIQTRHVFYWWLIDFCKSDRVPWTAAVWKPPLFKAVASFAEDAGWCMRDKTPRWDNNASEVLLAIQFDASVTLTYKLAFAFQRPFNLLLSCLCQSYGADSPLWVKMTSSTTWPNRMTNWTCLNHDILFYFCWHCLELGGSFEVNVQLSLKAASLWWSFNRPVTRIV